MRDSTLRLVTIANVAKSLTILTDAAGEAEPRSGWMKEMTCAQFHAQAGPIT